MKKITMVGALVCAMFMFSGCDNSEQPSPIDDNTELEDTTSVNPFEVLAPKANWPLTDAQLSQASRMNDFAFRLFRQLQKPGESLVLSPLSVDYALGMTALGAEGETRDSIVKALGFEPTEPQAMHDLLASLMEYLPSVDENVQINLANAFYLNAGRPELSPNPDYQKVLQESYKADCKAVKTSEQEGIDYMNGWCSKQTNGFIPKVFQEPLSDDNVCLLINAIYFKGDWYTPFDSNETHDRDFKQENGTSVKVPTMCSNIDAKYLETDLFQAVRLPYGKLNEWGHSTTPPSSFGMTILLPCEGKTTADILEWLTAERFAQMEQQMTEADVVMYLPSFETNVTTDLLGAFNQMNLPFNYNELRGLVLSNGKPRGLLLTKAYQSARIKVNEKGTEAAAVTIMDFTDGMPMNLKTFQADHPFVYLLTEQQTGTILFVGTFHGK